MAESQYSGSPQAGDLLFTPQTSFEPYFTHIANSSPSISITAGYGRENDNESDFIGLGNNISNEVPGFLGIKNFSLIQSRSLSPHFAPMDYAMSRSPSVASQRSEDMGDTPTRFLVIGNLPRVAPHKIFAFFQVFSFLPRLLIHFLIGSRALEKSRTLIAENWSHRDCVLSRIWLTLRKNCSEQK